VKNKRLVAPSSLDSRYDAPQLIEFVQVGPEGGKSNYHCFEGAQLAPATVEPPTEEARQKFILGMTPARLP
jgi:hypothetical protein